MIQQTLFRIAFLVLLAGMFAMRGFFMVKVRQAGETLMLVYNHRLLPGIW